MVLGLLWSVSAFAAPVEYFKNNDYILHKDSRGAIETKKKFLKNYRKAVDAGYRHCKSIQKNSYTFLGLTKGTQGQKQGLVSWDMDDRKLGYSLNRNICAKDFENAILIYLKKTPNYESRIDDRPYKYILNSTEKIEISNEDYAFLNKIKRDKKQDAIMFTIKDKREQCEAIGFKPKTEKFADCVLRLVELDINKQQDNKIAAAQNSGNMQIANQLLQMRNDNNAQYLIDLGQQLLTPQSFNSNIYLPQTQNCTIMGFDSFAKMTCN